MHDLFMLAPALDTKAMVRILASIKFPLVIMRMLTRVTRFKRIDMITTDNGAHVSDMQPIVRIDHCMEP